MNINEAWEYRDKIERERKDRMVEHAVFRIKKAIEDGDSEAEAWVEGREDYIFLYNKLVEELGYDLDVGFPDLPDGTYKLFIKGW